MKVNIYIESSIKSLKRQNGVVGFVLEAEGREENAASQFGTVKEATENQSQLLGLKFALMRIRDKSELAIWTDCTYMAAAFEQGWIAGWIERSWKTAKKKDVANREEWEAILKLLGENMPEFHIGENHSYKKWLREQTERRAEKHV